jgi:hypothetical protein
MKTLFFSILAIIQVAIALIPTFGKLYIDNKDQTDFKLTKTGMLFIFVTLLGLATTLGLFFLSEDEENNNRQIQDRQQKTRDSTITSGINKGVDSSRKVLFKDLSDALAMQNLRLDTVTNTLTKISDSSKIINNYAQTDPTLAIENGGFRLAEQIENRYTYTYDITSFSAASTNFDLYLNLILIPKIGPMKYIDKIKCLTTKSQISANGKISNLFLTLTTKESFIGFYILLNGTYTSADGQKKYSCEQLYQYNPILNNISLIMDENQKDLVLETIPK